MPSKELQRMIFPRIEESRILLESLPLEQQDMATQCFLDLLEWFRVVLLQDVVFLRQKFPSLSLWLEPPFNCPAFEDFATRLLHEARHGNDPMYIQIAKTVPHIAHILQDQFGNTLDTMNTHHNSSEIRMNRVETTLNECLEHLKPMSAFTARLLGEGVVARTVITVEPDSLNNSIHSGRLLASPTAAAAAAVVDNSSSQSESVSIQGTSIPQYRLNSTIKTVTNLWEEYDRGFIPGVDMPRGPAIRDLDERFGTKWRADDKCRKPYSRRKLIWEAILRAATNLNLPPDTIVEKIQRWQDNNKYSLNKIHNLLSTTAEIWGTNDVELLHIV